MALLGGSTAKPANNLFNQSAIALLDSSLQKNLPSSY
jgi:hypothetical protein